MPTWPQLIGVLPRLADCRQHRFVDDALAISLSEGGTAVICQVISGMGGVGKTQLAAHLAHQRWNERQVDLLVWLTASSRTEIISTYAQAAGEVTGVADTDPARAADRLLAWLAATDKRWLIILDDLIDPDDMTGLWPPDTNFDGSTIVTTRRRDAGLLAGRHLIAVDLFTSAESVAYLRAKLAAVPHLGDDLDGLASDVGCLPLALAQAVTYVIDLGLLSSQYRQRFASNRLDDLKPLSLPDQHRVVVHATWKMSMGLADLHSAGLSRPVLELASMLDPNGIPIDVLTTRAASGYSVLRSGSTATPEALRDVLYILDRLSLASLDIDNGTLRVHALVQRAVREAVDVATNDLTDAAAAALLERWPDLERDDSSAKYLRSSTAALSVAAGDALLSEQSNRVLFRMAESLTTAGFFSAAVAVFRRLADGLNSVLGAEHPDTLTARHDLAQCIGNTGNPVGALLAFRQVLADRSRALGVDHEDTLTSRHEVAFWRGEAGDPVGAAQAMEELVVDRIRILGPDHPHTLVTRANAARWQGRAGNAAAAFAGFRGVVSDSARALGLEHPDTLTARHNCAQWRGFAGDAVGAAEDFQRLLADRIRVFSPYHLETMQTRHEAAFWQGQSGDIAGALRNLEMLLQDRHRILGPHHPHTLRTRASIARLRRSSGEPAAAVADYNELVTMLREVFGPSHSETLTAREGLALSHGEAGDRDFAVTELERLLADRIRALAPDHPDVTTTRGLLARWQVQDENDA